MPDKTGSASSGAETANKIITVPVFHLFHKFLAGNVHTNKISLRNLIILQLYKSEM